MNQVDVQYLISILKENIDALRRSLLKRIVYRY